MQNYAPKISIVIPLFNKEKEIYRAVGSVLAQTVSDFELIVVNDGSTDKSPEIVRSIEDSRIKMIDQENAGVSAARNRGIHESRSDLIAFLDADDEWKPSFLETILNLKEKFPTCSVFATNYLFRETNGKLRLPIICGIPPHPWEGIIDDYFGVAVKSDPPLWTSAVAVIKEAIQSVALFPEGVTGGEDLLTWARLAVNFDIAYTTKPESIFCLRAPITGSPVRFHDKIDIVGTELESLLGKVEKDKKDIFKEYIALWYRMRASTNLEIGCRKEALLEIKKMRRFSKRILLIYLYSAVAFMPDIIFNETIKGFTLVKMFRRRLIMSSKNIISSFQARDCLTNKGKHNWKMKR
jgi:glycosyltransferase involved in cell wall biosynthesis